MSDDLYHDGAIDTPRTVDQDEREDTVTRKIDEQEKTGTLRKVRDKMDASTQDPSSALIIIFGVCCFFLGAQYNQLPIMEILKNLEIERAITDGLQTGITLLFTVFAFFLAKNNSKTGGGIGDAITDTRAVKFILDKVQKRDK